MSQLTVDVGGVALSVTEDGAGAPVILVHGFPELAYSWRHQIPALAASGFRALAYDQRGYGASSHPEPVDAYRLEVLVGDLIGLADALRIDRFALVGHDWGSIVAWTAAVLHPDRITRLVSLNVPYRGWYNGFPSLEYIRDHAADRFGYVLSFQEPGRAEAAFAADPARWLRGFYGAVAANPGFQTDEEFSVYVEAFVAHGIAGPLNFYRNLERNADFAASHANAPVTIPVMMVAADADPILPQALAVGMERWIPDMRVETITQCGHWTQQEQPDEVSRLLIDYLA